jgi:hypothetical protein
MNSIGKVIEAMIDYFENDVRRINHFMKVFAFAKTIGEGEKLDSYSQNLLEAAAVVHDIGIKLSEQKYNSSAGKFQEQEGPAEAEKLLQGLEYEQKFIDEIKFLVAHHHTYDNINSMPYQILVEADFIVNLFEDKASMQAIQSAYEKIFRTETGKALMQKMYFESRGEA